MKPRGFWVGIVGLMVALGAVAVWLGQGTAVPRRIADGVASAEQKRDAAALRAAAVDPYEIAIRPLGAGAAPRLFQRRGSGSRRYWVVRTTVGWVPARDDRVETLLSALRDVAAAFVAGHTVADWPSNGHGPVEITLRRAALEPPAAAATTTTVVWWPAADRVLVGDNSTGWASAMSDLPVLFGRSDLFWANLRLVPPLVNAGIVRFDVVTDDRNLRVHIENGEWFVDGHSSVDAAAVAPFLGLVNQEARSIIATIEPPIELPLETSASRYVSPPELSAWLRDRGYAAVTHLRFFTDQGQTADIVLTADNRAVTFFADAPLPRPVFELFAVPLDQWDGQAVGQPSRAGHE